MADIKNGLKDVKPEECENCFGGIKRLYIVFDREKKDAGHFCSLNCVKEYWLDYEFKRIVTVKGPKGVKKYVI